MSNGAFTRGVTAGRQTGPSGAGGFMGQLLSSIVKVDERRRVEDELRQKENRALIDTVKKLTAQSLLKGEIEPTQRPEEAIGIGKMFGLKGQFKRTPTEEETKPTFGQQTARSNALSMLKRGDFENMREAEDYLIDELKVDITDPEIQNELIKYKKPKTKKGFFQKYPQKKKFGYTYEKREDGQWHRID